VESNDTGIISSDAREMISGLMGISGERGVVKGTNAVIKDNEGDDLKEILKVDSSLSSNETSRFKQVFGIFKDVVFAGPEAEKLQAAKVSEKMRISGSEKDVTLKEKSKDGFLSKLLMLIGSVLGTAATFLQEKLTKLLSPLKTLLDDMMRAVTRMLVKLGLLSRGGAAPRPARRAGPGTAAPPGRAASGSITTAAGATAANSAARVPTWWDKTKTAARNVATRAGAMIPAAVKAPLAAMGGVISKHISLSKMGGILKRVPGLSTIIEGLFATYDIKSAIDMHKNRQIDKAELDQIIGRRVLEGVGAIGGITIGAAIGSALLGPGFGTFVGAVGGDFAGRWVMNKFLDTLGADLSGVGSTVLDIFKVNLKQKDQQNEDEVDQEWNRDDIIFNQPFTDFVKHSDGSITRLDNQDDVLGIKTGGAVDRLIDSAIKSGGNKLSDTLLQQEVSINKRIAQIAQDQTELLRVIATNTSINQTKGSVVQVSQSGRAAQNTTSSIRKTFSEQPT